MMKAFLFYLKKDFMLGFLNTSCILAKLLQGDSPAFMVTMTKIYKHRDVSLVTGLKDGAIDKIIGVKSEDKSMKCCINGVN